jgi:hypothetical protein
MEYFEVWFLLLNKLIYIYNNYNIYNINIHCSSIGDTSIAPVFDYLFSTIIG